MNNEIEKNAEPTAEIKVTPAKLPLSGRAVLTLISCGIAYLLTSTHFLVSVRVAHFLGDASYIPPSILRFTGILFRQGEVEAGAQILFFVVWLILVAVGCAVLFFGATLAVNLIIGLVADEPTVEAVGDCFMNGIICLAPVLALSLLTLLIMPLEGTHAASDSPSMAQIGELMSFGEFLFTMSQGTVVMFLVCFFVVVTVAVAYLMDFIYPGGSLYFFISIFAGVCVGITLIMILGHYIFIAVNLINLTFNNAYLTHYLIFGVYATICTALILPSVLKRGSEPETRRERIQTLKAKKKNKQKKHIAVVAS